MDVNDFRVFLRIWGAGGELYLVADLMMGCMYVCILHSFNVHDNCFGREA